jgi:hypothetical protein
MSAYCLTFAQAELDGLLLNGEPFDFPATS